VNSHGNTVTGVDPERWCRSQFKDQSTGITHVCTRRIGHDDLHGNDRMAWPPSFSDIPVQPVQPDELTHWLNSALTPASTYRPLFEAVQARFIALGAAVASLEARLRELEDLGPAAQLLRRVNALEEVAAIDKAVRLGMRALSRQTHEDAAAMREANRRPAPEDEHRASLDRDAAVLRARELLRLAFNALDL
jgi:hypothetical protein